MGKGKSGDKKGKKPHKNKPTGKKYAHFTIEGDSVIRKKNCPRCGPGIFLSTGQGREYCGKCHYTKFN
jgi:small subunit ribosomal protein S27Ae